MMFQKLCNVLYELYHKVGKSLRYTLPYEYYHIHYLIPRMRNNFFLARGRFVTFFVLTWRELRIGSSTIVLCVKYTKKPPFRPVFRVSACTFINSLLGEECTVYKHLWQDPVHESWFLRGCVFYIWLLRRRTGIVHTLCVLCNSSILRQTYQLLFTDELSVSEDEKPILIWRFAINVQMDLRPFFTLFPIPIPIWFAFISTWEQYQFLRIRLCVNLVAFTSFWHFIVQPIPAPILTHRVTRVDRDDASSSRFMTDRSTSVRELNHPQPIII